MGPRARRRLIVAGVLLLAVIAIVIAVVVLTSSGGHASHATGPNTFGPNADKRFAANHDKLAFGLTKRQMLKLFGPPDRVVGDCWQYRLDETIHFNGAYTIEAERLCFAFGAYAVQYTQSSGNWHDANGQVVANPTQ